MLPGDVQQSGLPPCDAVQKAGQWLGNVVSEGGSYVTNAGLLMTGGGLAIAGVGGLAAVTGPESFLPGLAVGVAGLNVAAQGSAVTGHGGLIQAAGATISVVSGSGKDAVVELSSQMATRVLPNGLVKDFRGAAANALFDAIEPELRSCQN